jgi:hypothetical protein
MTTTRKIAPIAATAALSSETKAAAARAALRIANVTWAEG